MQHAFGRRLVAAVIIAAVPALFVPPLADSVSALTTRVAEAALAGDAGPRDDGATDEALPELPGFDFDDERLQLRSVSTSPTRPRLAPGRDAGTRTLQRRNARIRVDDLTPGAFATVLADPGVHFATVAYVDEVLMRHDGERTKLDVAFVHPPGFRVFAPMVTAVSEGLWHGLDAGDIALTHETAGPLGIRPGDEVSLGSILRSHSATVGATMSLDRPAIADAMMHVNARPDVARNAPATIIVSVNRLSELDAVIDRLQASGVGTVTRVPDLPHRAELIGDHAPTAAAFEPFTFVQGRGGTIKIDPAWVDRNIVTAELPIVGKVKCHRLIIPQLRAALEEVIARGYDVLLDPDDYGGCWVPRHIGRNANNSLSTHAWGTSFDVNVHSNLYGDQPQIDLRIVEVFERHGFNWGGRWRTPDGMHFELGELFDP